MSSKALKKCKSKAKKLAEKLDSDSDESVHELSFYLNDRVKLMKEVLKIIKPKKIKSMAPECIKNLDIEEINSMLLEELLGISNKRLKYIFNGQNLSEDSSSTDPEEENKPIDVISLDDVSSGDDFSIVEIDADKTQKKKRTKVKEEPKSKGKKVKKEKSDKKDLPLQEENLMSVLELLELQARARAIRSQLMLEASKKPSQSTDMKGDENSDSDDSIIIEVPKNEEIVIESSGSDTESQKATNSADTAQSESQGKKITLIRDRFEQNKTNKEIDSPGDRLNPDKTSENNNPVENTQKENDDPIENHIQKIMESNLNCSSKVVETATEEIENHNDDEIILIVDQDEIDGIIGD